MDSNEEEVLWYGIQQGSKDDQSTRDIMYSKPALAKVILIEKPHHNDTLLDIAACQTLSWEREARQRPQWISECNAMRIAVAA